MKGLPVVLVDVVDRADVGVLERGGRAGLALEPLERLRVARQLLGQELQRDAAAELQVLGLVDDAHAAAAELREDPVVGDRLADHAWTRRFYPLYSAPILSSEVAMSRPLRLAVSRSRSSCPPAGGPSLGADLRAVAVGPIPLPQGNTLSGRRLRRRTVRRRRAAPAPSSCRPTAPPGQARPPNLTRRPRATSYGTARVSVAVGAGTVLVAPTAESPGRVRLDGGARGPRSRRLERLAVSSRGDAASILTSPDGIAWQSAARSRATRWYDVAWNGREFRRRRVGRRGRLQPDGVRTGARRTRTRATISTRSPGPARASWSRLGLPLRAADVHERRRNQLAHDARPVGRGRCAA